MAKKIVVSEGCIACGLCTASEYIEEKADGTVVPKGGVVLEEEEEKAFQRFVEECPVKVLFVESAASKTKEEIIAHMEREAGSFELPVPTMESLYYEKEAMTINAPSIVYGEYRYEYSSYNRAKEAAKQAIDKGFYSQRKAAVQNVIKDYQVAKLSIYFEYKETPGNFYYEANESARKWLEDWGQEIRLNRPGVMISEELLTIQTRPNSKLIKEFQRFIKTGVLDFAGNILAELSDSCYSLSSYVDYCDIDDQEEYAGEGMFGRIKYVTKYCFRNTSEAFKEMKKDLEEACKYSFNERIAEQAYGCVKGIVEAYSKDLKVELKNKGKQLKKILEEERPLKTQNKVEENRIDKKISLDNTTQNIQNTSLSNLSNSEEENRKLTGGSSENRDICSLTSKEWSSSISELIYANKRYVIIACPESIQIYDYINDKMIERTIPPKQKLIIKEVIDDILCVAFYVYSGNSMTQDDKIHITNIDLTTFKVKKSIEINLGIKPYYFGAETVKDKCIIAFHAHSNEDVFRKKSFSLICIKMKDLEIQYKKDCRVKDAYSLLPRSTINMEINNKYIVIHLESHIKGNMTNHNSSETHYYRIESGKENRDIPEHKLFSENTNKIDAIKLLYEALSERANLENRIKKVLREAFVFDEKKFKSFRYFVYRTLGNECIFIEYNMESKEIKYHIFEGFGYLRLFMNQEEERLYMVNHSNIYFIDYNEGESLEKKDVIEVVL